MIWDWDWNPNGESSCDAAHMASDKAYRTGGLLARVFTASPMETRLI